MDVTRDACETDEQFRRAFSELRNRGEATFAGMIRTALQNYAETNGDQFPTSVSQLKSYFAIPVDDTLLQRFEVVPTELVKTKLTFVLPGKSLIVQKSRVDEELDQRWIVCSNGIIALNSKTEISVGTLGTSVR